MSDISDTVSATGELGLRLGLFNYWVVIGLMMIGFYVVISQRNLIKAIIGLNIFQTSVFLLYITMGKVRGGTAPIVAPGEASEAHGTHDPHGTHEIDAGNANVHSGSTPQDAILDHFSAPVETLDATAEVHSDLVEVVYSHPLPSVLMLTAIVVGIATTALALSLIVRVREAYGTIEEDESLAIDAGELELGRLKTPRRVTISSCCRS